jgi:hypothetical protein
MKELLVLLYYVVSTSLNKVGLQHLISQDMQYSLSRARSHRRLASTAVKTITIAMKSSYCALKTFRAVNVHLVQIEQHTASLRGDRSTNIPETKSIGGPFIDKMLPLRERAEGASMYLCIYS